MGKEGVHPLKYPFMELSPLMSLQYTLFHAYIPMGAVRGEIISEVVLCFFFCPVPQRGTWLHCARTSLLHMYLFSASQLGWRRIWI